MKGRPVAPGLLPQLEGNKGIFISLTGSPVCGDPGDSASRAIANIPAKVLAFVDRSSMLGVEVRSPSGSGTKSR